MLVCTQRECRSKIKYHYKDSIKRSRTNTSQNVCSVKFALKILKLFFSTSQTANQPSNIPEKVIKSFPTETVRQGSALLNPGMQCRICLRGYSISQVLRRLPCKHKVKAVREVDLKITHESLLWWVVVAEWLKSTGLKLLCF